MRKLRKSLKWAGFTVIGLLLILAVSTLGRSKWINRTRVDCPILAWLKPLPSHPIAPTDSLTLTYSNGWGQVGTIQVFGDGKVERDTTITLQNGVVFGCPLRDEDKHLRIDQKTATDLLAKAQHGGFCRLCALYRYPGRIFDAGEEELKLSIAGTNHRVSNFAGTPPSIFGDLDESIQAATPLLPGYATGRTQSPADDARCKAFEDQQEITMTASRRAHLFAEPADPRLTQANNMRT